jgi:transposase
MPAEYVRPFVKSNKNDYIDAEAIAEAVQRPTMRFVPIKTEAQLDLQALHRVRDRWMGRRTAVINQIRGFLLEHGITIAVGPAHLKRQIPSILEDADNLLSPRMRALLVELRDEWEKLETQIEPSPGSDHSQRLRSPPRSEMLRHSTKAATWRRGLAWFRASTQQAANQDFSALASVAILIFGGFSSTGVEPSSHARNAKITHSAIGLINSKRDPHGMQSSLPWPTSSHESPGRY